MRYPERLRYLHHDRVVRDACLSRNAPLLQSINIRSGLMEATNSIAWPAVLTVPSRLFVLAIVSSSLSWNREIFWFSVKSHRDSLRMRVAFHKRRPYTLVLQQLPTFWRTRRLTTRIRANELSNTSLIGEVGANISLHDYAVFGQRSHGITSMLGHEWIVRSSVARRYLICETSTSRHDNRIQKWRISQGTYMRLYEENLLYRRYRKVSLRSDATVHISSSNFQYYSTTSLPTSQLPKTHSSGVDPSALHAHNP
jgi:hypothetical protein